MHEESVLDQLDRFVSKVGEEAIPWCGKIYDFSVKKFTRRDLSKPSKSGKFNVIESLTQVRPGGEEPNRRSHCS